MGRRTLLLIAALIVAALGTTGVFLYVNGVDDRAQAGLKIQQVLVATAGIPVGTPAKKAQDDGSMVLRDFLADSVADLDARSNLAGIENLVALAPIAVGEPILTSQFGAPGETSRLPIPEGKLAVSLQLDDPARVAGFVEPGSEVVVFVTIAAVSGANAGNEVTRVLLERVSVIAAGEQTLITTTTTTGDTAQTEVLPKALLTVAVDQVDAQKIVYAQGRGQVTFGLLDEYDVDKSDDGTGAENLFD